MSSTPAGSLPTAPSSRLAATGRPFPERVPWEDLGEEFLQAWGRPRGQWQPEHVEILGGTGSGKSWFEKTILQARAARRGSHVVVLVTKPADRTISSMGWPVVTSWPPSQWKKENAQVIYWAKANGLSAAARAHQRAAVEDLLNRLWRPDSNIILAIDEIAYVEQELGLRHAVTTYYREARGLGITVVANTQRPQGVSRFVHSESTWKVIFAFKDEDDRDRVAQILGDRKFYREVLDDLDQTKREFLLLHTLTKEAYISHIPPPAGAGRERPERGPEPGTRRPDRSV